MLTNFGLFLFIYLLIDSFFSYRLFLVDFTPNVRPEVVYRNYVFGHSYHSDIYFSNVK